MELSQKYISAKWLLIAVFGAFAVFLLPQAAVAKGKRITLEELVIEGNIQKPEAFFILPRAALNFDELQRRENLKNRIIESVKKKPF